MGNLKDALRRNAHLENQNRGLIDALKRKNGQLAEYKEQSAQAIAQISEITAGYLGAVCLSNEAREIKILHDDIKRVLAEFDVEVQLGGDGITFKLVEKNAE